MFSLFKIKEQKDALRTEAVAAAQQVRAVAQRTLEHTSALGELFSAEVKEYAQHQVKRVAMVIIACVLLLGAYFVFCAVLAVVLGMWLGLAWSLGVVCLLNFALALLLLLRVRAMGGKQLAPATVEELKNDWQCLKLLCKGNNER
ncbi:MAG: phage holin family protein [Akkermansia sp.]|nr:phage holin family protein [Akkermansia sp.]